MADNRVLFRRNSGDEHFGCSKHFLWASDCLGCQQVDTVGSRVDADYLQPDGKYVCWGIRDGRVDSAWVVPNLTPSQIRKKLGR